MRYGYAVVLLHLTGSRAWSFTKGLAKSIQGNRRAILEQFQEEHGDKRIALMHSQALQGIINKKTPAAQRNFRKAMRGFIDHCVSLKMITVDPLAPRR